MVFSSFSKKKYIDEFNFINLRLGQRPSVLEGIALDFFIVRNLADAVQPLVPTQTSARSIVDEFAYRVFGELDYIQVDGLIRALP